MIAKLNEQAAGGIGSTPIDVTGEGELGAQAGSLAALPAMPVPDAGQPDGRQTVASSTPSRAARSWRHAADRYFQAAEEDPETERLRGRQIELAGDGTDRFEDLLSELATSAAERADPLSGAGLGLPLA